MRRLKPLRVTPVVTPQCSVKFDPASYGPHYLVRRKARFDEMGWDITCCGKPSSYEIDGTVLCTQHAGIKALKILLEQEGDK